MSALSEIEALPNSKPTLDKPSGLRRRLAGVALALALVGWWSSQRLPCGPDAGTELEGAPRFTTTAAHRTIRLGTFNIHGGKGSDGVLDLERTAHAVRGLDLVGLNEVHGPWFWQASDQAKLLAEALGLGWKFAPADLRYWHYRFGNGVLSSLHVSHWQRVPLPRQYGKSFRNVLLLAVDLESSTLQVLITHLDRSDDREREAQLQSVSEMFLALSEPAVLMGDLNTSTGDPGIARLLSQPGVRDPLADLAHGKTPARIDWILTRGLRAVDGGMGAAL